jgi:hypothetical protein
MKKNLFPKKALACYCILSLICLFAEVKSVKAQNANLPAIKFKTGIYLSLEQLINNDPIPVATLMSFSDDCIPKNIKSTLIDYKRDHSEINANMKKARCQRIFFFSFADNLVPYYRGSSGQWITFGRISIITIYTAKVYRGVVHDHYKEYDPMNGWERWPFKDNFVNGPSLDIYLLDLNSWKAIKFNSKKLSSMFKTDPDIYQEFTSLKKHDRKEKALDFIQRYNDRYPIFSTQK